MASHYIVIDLNDQKIGLKFGMLALRAIREKEQQVPFHGEYPDPDKPGQTITTYNELAYAHIMCAGYCNNQYMKNEPATIPFEDFYTLVEDLLLTPDKFVEFITPIINCFTSNPLLKQHIESQGKINEPVQPTQRAETPKKKYK